MRAEAPSGEWAYNVKRRTQSILKHSLQGGPKMVVCLKFIKY